MKMHTLGSTFVPEGIHAGGLRYHRMAPLMSHVVALGLAQARSEYQLGCFAARLTFTRAESILPALEANHAVKAAIDEAFKCKESGENKVILFNLCGHGHFDIQAYIDYQAGKLIDTEYSSVEVAMALAELPIATVKNV
jgi:tryptophan synthase beta chain